MSRRRTRPQSTYEAQRRRYLQKKSRTHVLSDAERAFLTGVPTVGEPEPLAIPLDGLVEPTATVGDQVADETTVSAEEPTAVPVSAPSVPSDAERRQKEQAAIIAKKFTNHLRSCNELLKAHSKALVLPEIVFSHLIEPCAASLCERHADKLEIGERGQTLVVIVGAAATMGQLYMLERRQKPVEVATEATSNEGVKASEPEPLQQTKRPTSLAISRPAKVSDLFSPSAHGVVRPR